MGIYFNRYIKFRARAREKTENLGCLIDFDVLRCENYRGRMDKSILHAIFAREYRNYLRAHTKKWKNSIFDGLNMDSSPYKAVQAIIGNFF